MIIDIQAMHRTWLIKIQKEKKIRMLVAVNSVTVLRHCLEKEAPNLLWKLLKFPTHLHMHFLVQLFH